MYTHTMNIRHLENTQVSASSLTAVLCTTFQVRRLYSEVIFSHRTQALLIIVMLTVLNQELAELQIIQKCCCQGLGKDRHKRPHNTHPFLIYWLLLTARIYVKALWNICKDFNGLVCSKISDCLWFYTSALPLIVLHAKCKTYNHL